MNRRPTGFTLIEIIVAMVIIVILGTITVVGVRSMIQQSKSSATRVVLQTAESIFDEWRRSAGTSGKYPSQTWPENILPASLNEFDDGNDRIAKAVRLTRGMMFRMNQSPAARKAISAMPADQLWSFEIDPPNISGTHANLADPGALECVAGGLAYICFYTRVSNDYPDPPVAANLRNDPLWPNFWLQTSAKTPVFVDAWNNPIIFFPTCGFLIGNQIYTSHGVFQRASAGLHWSSSANYSEGEFVIHAGADGVFHLFRCVDNHSANDTNAPATGSGVWEQIPTRPFFASAGPDGVFYDPANPDTLQDNIYSFER